MTRLTLLLDLVLPSRLVRLVGRTPLPTSVEEVWIPTRDGRLLYGHLHRPATSGQYPGVVFVPGTASPGTVYDRGGEMQPKTVASLGFSVVHYDPSGRGRTGGKEDFWGTRQQDELFDLLLWASARQEIDSKRVGIVSFSVGINIAAGALARYSTDLSFVSYLYDWEGPSNRYVITKNDTHPLLQEFPTTDNDFWIYREPCRFISRIKCGYFRYQAATDHMQGQNRKHALELVNLATRGEAYWTRLNHNPRNKIYHPPVPDSCWVSTENNNRAQILRFLLKIAENDHV